MSPRVRLLAGLVLVLLVCPALFLLAVASGDRTLSQVSIEWAMTVLPFLAGALVARWWTPLLVVPAMALQLVIVKLAAADVLGQGGVTALGSYVATNIWTLAAGMFVAACIGVLVAAAVRQGDASRRRVWWGAALWVLLLPATYVVSSSAYLTAGGVVAWSILWLVFPIAAGCLIAKWWAPLPALLVEAVNVGIGVATVWSQIGEPSFGGTDWLGFALHAGKTMLLAAFGVGLAWLLDRQAGEPVEPIAVEAAV